MRPRGDTAAEDGRQTARGASFHAFARVLGAAGHAQKIEPEILSSEIDSPCRLFRWATYEKVRHGADEPARAQTTRAGSCSNNTSRLVLASPGPAGSC